MGVDSLDLDIAGSRTRVIVDDGRVMAGLRRALGAHIVEQPAEPGFVVQSPRDGQRFFLLLDRSGFVLSRTRSPDDCLAVLGSHLAGLLSPPPGTIRLVARALVADDGSAVLATFPLFAVPPIVERQLVRHGYRMVDRLAIDVATDGSLAMTPTPWATLDDLHEVDGHARAPRTAPIARIAMPWAAAEPPSHPMVVAHLAASMATSLSREQRIALAESLARLDLVTVAPDQRATRYELLARNRTSR